LGDLFETWIGDDEDDPVYQTVLAALHRLTAKNIQVNVMCGNRDFLLGVDFAELTGCRLIPDPSVIDLYGIPTLVMHGDSLCTLDVEYQLFCQQVRTPQWIEQFLACPLAQRRQLAQQARLHSQVHLQNTSQTITDVSPEAVFLAFKDHRVTRLIHGHTHRPAMHQLEIDGQLAYRYVVGAWNTSERIGLRCTAADWQLVAI
jgi:UDP-2,3-diacylglucosamine hydrolase